MRTGARLLLVWNAILLVPATLYTLLWFFLTLVALLRSLRHPREYLDLFLVLLVLFTLGATLFTAIRLKVRILKEVRDPKVPLVRPLYRSASRINAGTFIVYYPLVFTLLSGSPLIVLALLVAMAAALPLWITAQSRKRQYASMRAANRLGQHRCRRCDTTLALPPGASSWRCLGCGSTYPMVRR